MLLINKTNGHPVEVLYLSELFSLYDDTLQGRYQVGDELMVTETFSKSDLMFASGEPLPKCWTDPRYRESELHRD